MRLIAVITDPGSGSRTDPSEVRTFLRIDNFVHAARKVSRIPR